MKNLALVEWTKWGVLGEIFVRKVLIPTGIQDSSVNRRVQLNVVQMNTNAGMAWMTTVVTCQARVNQWNINMVTKLVGIIAPIHVAQKTSSAQVALIHMMAALGLTTACGKIRIPCARHNVTWSVIG